MPTTRSVGSKRRISLEANLVPLSQEDVRFLT